MRKLIFITLLMLFTVNIHTLHANTDKKISSTVIASAYNPHTYTLYLNKKPQGFFNSYANARKAAYDEIARKACEIVELVENSDRILLARQHQQHRNNFLPWKVEIAPSCKAIYMSIAWEGSAEVALITPDGKRISQKNFGTTNTKILSNYAHEGMDIIILDPKPGIWQIWVLGKFKDANIMLPKFNNVYLEEYKVEKKARSLSFTTYWESKFYQDFAPAKFFLADSQGSLYSMQSYNKKILSEHTGYNGLAMEINNPTNGNWKLITLTTNSDLTNVKFKVLDSIKKIRGSITKVKYNAQTNDLLFYWQTSLATNFPKVLFLSILTKQEKEINNLIIPLNKNPQVIPADVLPKAFSYKYYISTPFGMGEDGLLSGPSIIYN